MNIFGLCRNRDNEEELLNSFRGGFLTANTPIPRNNNTNGTIQLQDIPLRILIRYYS